MTFLRPRRGHEARLTRDRGILVRIRGEGTSLRIVIGPENFGGVIPLPGLFQLPGCSVGA